MSFWIVDKEEKITGDFELGGGQLEPIPANTNVTAFIEEAKWDEYQDEEYISLKWKVLAPNDYKNRIIFHKLKVLQDDKKKAKKAQNMLLAIDFNAKKQLAELREQPSTEDLQKALCNKPMIINLQVWEMNDKKGNWITSVKPKGAKDPENIVVDEREKTPDIDVNEDIIPF